RFVERAALGSLSARFVGCAAALGSSAPSFALPGSRRGAALDAVAAARSLLDVASAATFAPRAAPLFDVLAAPRFVVFAVVVLATAEALFDFARDFVFVARLARPVGLGALGGVAALAGSASRGDA